MVGEFTEKRNRTFEENQDRDDQTKSSGVDPEERYVRRLNGKFAFAEHADLAVDSGMYDETAGGGDFEVEYECERRTLDIKTARNEHCALFFNEECECAGS